MALLNMIVGNYNISERNGTRKMGVREKMSNGKRLIDANRALEIVRDQGIAHPSAYYLTNYATLILREAPTVDAVEVVRCRDCVHYDFGVCLKIYSDGAVNQCAWQARNEDDFCSYGERKDGDGNG